MQNNEIVLVIRNGILCPVEADKPKDEQVIKRKRRSAKKAVLVENKGNTGKG